MTKLDKLKARKHDFQGLSLWATESGLPDKISSKILNAIEDLEYYIQVEEARNVDL